MLETAQRRAGTRRDRRAPQENVYVAVQTILLGYCCGADGLWRELFVYLAHVDDVRRFENISMSRVKRVHTYPSNALCPEPHLGFSVRRRRWI